ncbi:MAG: RNA recognition motif domain-containing protein [Acidimicrobiia bacterium]
MGRKLYVGNLPYRTDDAELATLFSRAGTVESARVMRDMMTGRARGFGFVEMATDEEAQKAVSDLHDFELEGRRLVVNEARPKPSGGGRGKGEGSYSGAGMRSRREPRW